VVIRAAEGGLPDRMMPKEGEGVDIILEMEKKGSISVGLDMRA
jgi:hypothetical protein